MYAKKNSGLRCIAHNLFQHKHGTLCHVYAKKIMDDGGGGKRQGVGCNEGGRWDAVKVGGRIYMYTTLFKYRIILSDHRTKENPKKFAV